MVSLLADLGPQLRQGGQIEFATSCLATGVDSIDHLLGGGFPRGRLCEVSGTLSSGRTSLALALIARTTAAQECVAFVDSADAFDPESAAAAGITLERVLWVRPRTRSEAMRCTERMLEADGFPLVLLDLSASTQAAPAQPPANSVAWLRLSRLAASRETALVVLSHERTTGTHAQIALEMQPAEARFEGVPALLEQLETRAELVRHRAAPTGSIVSLRLGSRAA